MMLTIILASFLLLGKTQGSQNFPLHCYWRSSDFSTKKIASYTDASFLCQSVGGHLTSLHSAEENEFVMSFLKSGGHSTGWLGVKFDEEDVLKSEVRRWEDKSLLTFTNWIDSSISPGCGSLSSQGYWQISNCEQLMAYVCKLSEQDCRREDDNVAHRKRRHAQHRFNNNGRFNPQPGLYNYIFHDNNQQQPQPPPELVDHSHRFAQAHIHQPESELTDQHGGSAQSTSPLQANVSHSNPDSAPLTTSSSTSRYISDPYDLPTNQPTLTSVDKNSSNPTTAQKLGPPASNGTVSPSVNVTQPAELEGPSSESSGSSQETGTSESTLAVTHSTQGCDQDQIAYGGLCYKINLYHATWAGAKRRCQTQGGRLAILDDRLKAEHLGSLANTTFLAWFGLSWSNTTLSFKWLTGQPLNSTNWNHLQGGDDGNHNDCVMVQLGEKMHAGTWFKDDCTNHHRYICELNSTNYEGPTAVFNPTTTTIPTTTTSVTTTTTTTTPSTTTTTTTTTTIKPIPACASGWMKMIDHCYELFSEPLTWEVADRMCHTYGAHLLTVSNSDENSLLRWLLTRERGRYFPEPIWVGLKMGLNLEHEWLDGSSFTSLDWSHNEPNTNDGRERCVRVQPRNYEFSTAVCVTTLPFICEAPEGMSITTLAPPTSAPDVLCQDHNSTQHNSTQHNSPWFLYNDYCYRFVGTERWKGKKALTWWESHLKCREEGGELASIHTLEENYWIMSKLSGLDVDVVWLGGRAQEGSGYSWLDEEPFDFINWRRGEPNMMMDQEDCIGMFTRQQGYWNDQNCAMAEGRVCKRPHGEFHPPVQPTPPPQGYCPQDWIYTGTKCFKIFTELQNVQSAIASCKNLSSSGNLASIHNPIEQAYLTSAMSTANDSVWIGLRLQNSRFYWMDQTVMTYTNWATGEPSGSTAYVQMWGLPLEACVEMLPFHEVGRWNNKDCSVLHGYVCQQSLDGNISHASWRSSCDAPLDQYINHAGQCYRIITTPATWKDAEEVCQSEGSHLVSILSMSEAATVWVLTVENGLEDVWLGLHQERGLLKWSSGWSALYTEWGGEEPSLNDSLHQCTKMNITDGLWYTDDCHQAKPFVCKFQNESVPTPDTPVEGSCPEEGEWHDFGGSFCYAIFSEERPWKDANMRCLRENGDLVSIHTEEENSFIQKAAHYIKDTFWIGLLQKRDNYGWSDGTKFDLTMWGREEPTEGGEKCVEMYVSTGKWNDIHCSNVRPFICKTAKIPPNVTESNDIRRYLTSEGLRQHHLTAAGTAGITLAIVLVVILALLATYTYRKRKMLPPKIDGGYSFDNALYSADESRTCEVVDETALHFYQNDPVDTDI